jgi:hypothetical protein
VKLLIITIFSMALLLSLGTAYACTVLDKEEARLGVSKGFRGECSNNGDSIICVLEQGAWVHCSGFGGSVTGTNLNSLIYSVCRCKSQDERRRRLEEQMTDF